MLFRAALVILAAVVIALMARSLNAHDRCADARQHVVAIAFGREPVAGEPAALRTIRDDCRGSDALVASSGALESQHRHAEALELAALAVRREPDSAIAWDALATAADGRLPGLSRRALARARELSPLGVPSQ